MSAIESNVPADPRRHDLDALRAMAMLLGILLHAAMSFVPGGWVVRDVEASYWATIFVSAVHAFRLPLFFLLSGYFTAMLWQKRGLRALIRHRVQRVLKPLLIGMVTIVPAVWAVSLIITRTPSAEVTRDAGIPAAQVSLGQSLLEAALKNDVQQVSELLAQGASSNAADGRGSTSMHIACLFGRAELASVLLDAGADPNIVNNDRSRPVDTLRVPWGLTKFYADLLKVNIVADEVAVGRAAIAQRLGISISPNESISGASSSNGLSAATISWLLFSFPLFHHLWFLWFLCWLLVGFVICVTMAAKLNLASPPPVLIVSAWRYVWLVPLVAVAQYFMSTFGPDTSQGFLPLPIVLFYYGIFFGFGALYFMAEGNEFAVHPKWWVALPVALVILFPVAFNLMQSSEFSVRALGAICGSAYTWLICFGLMDVFKRHVRAESKSMRYLADSSYWLYLAHLPLVLYFQHIVKDWPVSGWIKVPLMCVVVCGVLLACYQWFARYTWIGAMLNGPRQREPQAVVVSPAVKA